MHVCFTNKEGLDFLTSFIYGRNTIEERRMLWKELCLIGNTMNGESWLEMGDFNEVQINEWRGPGIHFDVGPSDFHLMMDKTNLLEMQSRGGSFTWSNGVVGLSRGESKIYRALMNSQWNRVWPNMVCELYQGGSSDHTGLGSIYIQLKSLRDLFVCWTLGWS